MNSNTYINRSHSICIILFGTSLSEIKVKAKLRHSLSVNWIPRCSSHVLPGWSLSTLILFPLKKNEKRIQNIHTLSKTFLPSE